MDPSRTSNTGDTSHHHSQNRQIQAQNHGVSSAPTASYVPGALRGQQTTGPQQQMHQSLVNHAALSALQGVYAQHQQQQGDQRSMNSNNLAHSLNAMPQRMTVQQGSVPAGAGNHRTFQNSGTNPQHAAAAAAALRTYNANSGNRSSWSVPNPLGLPNPLAPSNPHAGSNFSANRPSLQQGQQQMLPNTSASFLQHSQPSLSQQQSVRAPAPMDYMSQARSQQQQVRAQPPAAVSYQAPNPSQQVANTKPKVVLSNEAKQALAKAIWSAIRSPTGTIDTVAMDAALKTGLPRHAILNAARVAREREAAKRKARLQQQQQQQQQQQLKQQQQNQPQKVVIQNNQFKVASSPPPRQNVPSKTSTLNQAASQSQAAKKQPEIQQRQQEQISREVQLKVRERTNWKRVHNGVFMVQKGRFVAVPFSLGAMIRTQDTKSTVRVLSGLKRPREGLLSQIADIQKILKETQSSTASQNPLLDAERFKRVKIEPKKYAKGFDRVARKARQTAAEVLLKQTKDFNKAIASHQQDFFKFHRQRRADLARVSKVIRDSFDKEERRKEKDAIQAEKARLAALRANDMTAYSQLVEDTKNERLKYLLDKTEKHFKQISSLLQQHTTEDGAVTDAAGAPTSYYASAHAKSEEVRQPSILVGGDLKSYQLAGLQWLVSLYNNKISGVLADEMGLGKTIQAISLVAYLMEFKQNLGPYLVIVPLSTLSNWQSEFSKWCPAARLVCYKGTPSERKDVYKDHVEAGHFNVLLTTYEYIIKDKKFLRKIEWQYAIVDEGHRMKNAQSKFAVTLSTQYVTRFRLLLTGTPLMNDLSELWALLNFILPSVFNSVDTFDEWFSRPFAQFSGSGNDESADMLLSNEERILIIHRLHELLRPFMLRRVKSEVLDQLPEKVEKVLRCDLSSWQKELYKQISRKAYQDSSLLQGPSRGLNNVVMQLRKVCNHPYLFSPEGYHINDNIIRSSGKLALLDQMLPKLKAAGHRVLMFTQMTNVMTILEDYFSYRGYLSLRLDGSTPAEEREKRMYRFNAPDSPYFIFLLSTRAGGLGLNLTAADTVVIFDSDWNPMMDLQAQDRAHRIGQRSDVSVFRLVTYSPVEEKILSRATEKLNVSELVVESGQFNKQSLESDNSLERKKMMELLLTDFDATAQPKAMTDISGSDDADDDDDGSESSEKEDLNELLSNNEADYQLYSNMDRIRDENGGVLAPLFTSELDVPDWIRNPQGSASRAAFAATEVAEGSRKRKSVMYDDGLTEKQFLRMMEKQADEEEGVARKKQKTSKSPLPKAASPVPAGGSQPLESSLPVSASSELTDWTFRKLISCSKSVVNLKDPTTKRRLSDIFLEKPDPAQFPDYYEIIEKPIAINDILRKCRAKLYASIPEFKDDWRLMFSNARKFNGEGSWVVEDAIALEKELERVLKKNGFHDDAKPPTSKKKLRIKLSLKDLKARQAGA